MKVMFQLRLIYIQANTLSMLKWTGIEVQEAYQFQLMSAAMEKVLLILNPQKNNNILNFSKRLSSNTEDKIKRKNTIMEIYGYPGSYFMRKEVMPISLLE